MPQYLAKMVRTGAATLAVRHHTAWDTMIKVLSSLGGDVPTGWLCLLGVDESISNTGINFIERSMRRPIDVQICKLVGQPICARRSIRFNRRVNVRVPEQVPVQTVTNAAGLQNPAP
jgi:hypothetical protein